MKYFKVSKIDGKGFFPDEYNGDLFTVEFTENDGESWTTFSTHFSFEGADKYMREHVADHPGECALWEWRRPTIDPTGIELTPGDPERCKGNGKEDPMTCCCDECNYFLECFPEWAPGGAAWKGGK